MNKLKSISYLMAVCLLLTFTTRLSALENSTESVSTPPKKLLFVGNSFSFYNNGIHNHLGSLIRASGNWKAGENRHKLLTYSGGHLYEQINSLSGMLEIDTRGFDAVILQGHSNEAISAKKTKRFESALTEAVEMIREQDIEPILFMTWGYANNAKMADEVAQAYINQGKRLGVRVAPVGLAFKKASETLPDINLYVPDVLGTKNKQVTYRKILKHPSDAGTYLAACVFYSMIFNKSPENNLFISNLSKQDALALQKLSWKIVNKQS